MDDKQEVSEECVELKNIKYKTMLMNGVPIKETKSSNDLINLDKFLEDDKQNNKNEPWCRLNKTIKTKKLNEFVEVYTTDNELDQEDARILTQFFKLSLITFFLMIILLSFTESIHLKSLATILFGLFIIQLSYGKNLMVTVLSSKQMVLLGGASYALYITQGPIRQWFYWAVDKGFTSEKIASFLNPIVTISLSIIIFIYWEQPARKFL